MPRYMTSSIGNATLRVTVVPASEAFGAGFEGDAYRLECSKEAVPIAQEMGWLGNAAPLHTAMADLALDTAGLRDVQVSPEVKQALKESARLQVRAEFDANGMRLMSHFELSGQIYYFKCAFDDRAIPKEAGFRWNGSAWWTDRPADALKLVEHADSVQLAVELRAACTALPPILRPTCKVVSDLVCDIRLVGGVIRADFPAKNDGFLETIRENRYHWTGSHWIRTLTAQMGSPTDRMADIARALLEEGFLIRVHNAEAQAKAITGDFEAEETRWVAVVTGNDLYEGWYALSWRKADDLYEVAKSLPGARWIGTVLAVPPASYEAVADFAERYGFCMTPAAEALGDQQRAAIIGAITVTPAKRKNKPSAPKRRPEIKAVESAVDESLLDRDEDAGMAPLPEPTKPVEPTPTMAGPPVGVSPRGEGERVPGTTTVGLKGKFNQSLWRFETDEDEANREASDRAAVASVFDPMDLLPRDMEGFAVVARAWGTAKFVELKSHLQPGAEGPPKTTVRFNGRLVGFDVTKHLEFSIAQDDGRAVVTWLAPAFPRGGPLSTSFWGYDDTLGMRHGSAELGISKRPCIKWGDYLKEANSTWKAA